MRHTIVRRIIISITSVAAIACLAVGLAIPLRSSQAATAAPGNASPTPTQVMTYTLITGDRVAVSLTPDGRPNVTLLSSPTGATSFQVIASGQHIYVLPYDAAGYIG